MKRWTVLAYVCTLLLLLACSLNPKKPTATPTAKPTKTATSPIVVAPSATPTNELMATLTALPVATIATGMAQLTLPTVENAPLKDVVVVAENVGSGPFAVALLAAVPLEPGHKYQLVVSSPAGKVVFHGEWSTSAVGKDGIPGVDVGLLDGMTVTTYDIIPPVPVVAKDWIYSVSVQNKGAGGISVVILDVTGK